MVTYESNNPQSHSASQDRIHSSYEASSSRTRPSQEPNAFTAFMDEIGSIFRKVDLQTKLKSASTSALSSLQSRPSNMEVAYLNKEDELMLKRTALISYTSHEDIPIRDVAFLWKDYMKLFRENMSLNKKLNN